MKRLLVACAAAMLALPTVALANNGNDYGEQPGFDNAIANSNGCAGHGAFGAFGGPDNNFAGGANGDATAFNNSTLCGNPQGAAGTIGG